MSNMYSRYSLFYEKLAGPLIIAVVSASVLYIYNVYAKAFEVAQTQSQTYSTLASKLQELVLNNTVKASQEIRSAFNKSRVFPKDIANSVDALAIEIGKNSILLAGRLPKSASKAKEISDLLKETVVDFSSGLNFDAAGTAKFDKQIAEGQQQFSESFRSEIRQLAIGEFRDFYSQFENEIGYWRPQYLFWSALGLLIVSTVVLFTLPGVKKSAPRRRRRIRS